ncbi:acyltransferase, partial [Bacillus cereus]|uniref:acyltransferase n=1 Tax=Bacillus cereus TaxID=1396 RepID=UPI00345BE517
LRNFTLSLADQYAPPAAVSLILFYPANNNDRVKNDERAHRLKTSLSEILTHFYPLAGTIDNNQFIDCNDVGVNFFEARVTGRQLSQILNHPIPEELV